MMNFPNNSFLKMLPAEMVLPNDFPLPSDEELTVTQELNISSPALRAAAYHMGKYCDTQSKEFILCRNETEDPRKCLKEGKEVTACGVKFLQLVKKMCLEEFNKYMHCIDHGSAEMLLVHCRSSQRVFDRCMFEKLNMERPPLGYFSRPRIHVTNRPAPVNNDFPDYKKEASKIINELPEDYPTREEHKCYYEPHNNPFM
ncbi:NADH dehydrogenase [ubiquinone] 1 alpha subcomplex subunit 8 [Trichinella sp. T6]|nr:NADH dehydrogenase [ubiquinone] 1 alpha subcomplex subunit 8 [Trichinella sp. T6]